MRGEYSRAVTEGLGGFAVGGELLKGWNDGGVWRFEGVAATGGLDRQGERLAAGALGRIAQSHGVELRAAHRAGRIGVVEECWVKGDEVWVRGRLEEQSAEAARVYTRLKRGETLGLSVGGKVTGARWAWDAEVEKPVRLIEDVELSHVAVCEAGAAVNPGTWVRATASSPPGPLSLGGPAGEGENGKEETGAYSPGPLSGQGGGERHGGGESLTPRSPLRSGEGENGTAEAGASPPAPSLSREGENGTAEAGAYPPGPISGQGGGERHGGGESLTPRAPLRSGEGENGAAEAGASPPAPSLSREGENGVRRLTPGPSPAADLGRGEKGNGGQPPRASSLSRDGGEDGATASSPPGPLSLGGPAGEGENDTPRTDCVVDGDEEALRERLGRLEVRIRELEGELRATAGDASGEGLRLAESQARACRERDVGERLGAAEVSDEGSPAASDGGADREDGNAGGVAPESGEALGAVTVAEATDDGPDGDGARVGTTEVVVRRGEPQGLSGHLARPVRAAQVWEGVL